MKRRPFPSFPRKRESSVARRRDKDSCALLTQRGWIPACAGMTGLVFLLLASPCRAASFQDHLRYANPPRKIMPLVFEDDNGQQRSLSDYRGAFIVLNIWATWCSPCVQEMPSLDALQQQFEPRRLIVLPLSEDRGDATVSVFYHAHALHHLPIAVDKAGIAPSTFNLRGLPTTLLIDSAGNEIARVEGDINWSTPEVAAYLRSQINH